jgi:hypothetical protein
MREARPCVKLSAETCLRYVSTMCTCVSVSTVSVVHVTALNGMRGVKLLVFHAKTGTGR